VLERRADLREQWHHVGGRPVRSLRCGQPRDGVPELVLVSGLGALGYVLPTVSACASWTRVTLLDLPGFGSARTAGLPADLAAVAAAADGWLEQEPTGPVVLLGHSTGAQVVLRAAVQRPAAVRLLVLGGMTFDPAARSPAVLARRVRETVVHEHPGEVAAVLPYYLRGARGLPALLRSALADRPEDRIAAVRSPVLVLRGQHDALCPADWARSLAAGTQDGRALQLPGAHNVPYTHPALLSSVLAQAVERV
jgi:pimeloyl-ACP methyl ester carboxylesterase